MTPAGIVKAIVFSGALQSSLKEFDVDFEQWKFSDDDLGALGTSIGQLSRLHNFSIDISSAEGTSYTGIGVTNFLGGLKAASTHLSKVVLDISGSGVRDDHMGQIGQALGQYQRLST